ncbi:MAG: DNA polymerase III subunit alpha [Dermatophilus congolensis]|nr:DNA polymerase III subunit alpha [Dermatophilus congolensis]
MGTEFVHLHTASGYSLRYGTSTPADLVERAVEHGQEAVALTDRDGLYGAVRFVRAAQKAGIASVVGVDLALDMNEAGSAPTRSRGPRVRQAVRGGMFVDPRHPRVTVLARGAGAGIPRGVGWARLCRLVTATHLRGERGRPVTTAGLIAEHARLDGHGGRGFGGAGSGVGAGDSNDMSALLVLLGPDSDVGRAVLAGRRDEAEALLAAWARRLPRTGLAVEIVDHGGPPGSMGNTVQARRMLALADAAGLPAVLTASVRHADPSGARVADVLDAARRLVILDERHLDRVSLAGHLASTQEMTQVAVRVAGDDHRRLLETSTRLAAECALQPRADLGIGQVHLPEPAVLGLAPGENAQRVLAERCRDAVAWRYPDASARELDHVRMRLDDELGVIAALGYPTYFLTVAKVCDLIREMGVRVAARGSGAGSLVNHLLGISGVDPIRHDLLMERFCTPLRAQLPDIDIDVESARREEVYERILDTFGGERVTCVSMMETYRVRHAIRDVGSALGLPPGEVDTIAKAFPHIRARDARAAMRDLPELASLTATSRNGAASALGLDMLFELAEALDGLPRHVALHPCGVILCNTSLLDRTPVEASGMGFPMSQFDKDDVEDLGLLKLDVLGIRMQSAMAHAVAEIARVDGEVIDLDDRAQVDLEDPATFELIRSTETLGCFQIESPGQRELIGKFAPETFEDIIIDISLFRPGPVKSDMIMPFLRARQGWAEMDVIHPTLLSALEPTCGVVVFHEQVLRIVAITTGASLAQADEVRRALGTIEGREEVEVWWRERAAERGYAPADADRIWEVLASFGSFGFCKAHAAAFALPTVQSAWLKTHHPAAFYAGLLTHDPGMYPKRLILGDARRFGVSVAGLDVNASGIEYRVEPGQTVRLSLVDVSGMSEAEAERIVAGRPYATLEDFWSRAQPSRPIAEKLVLAGGFDAMYGIDAGGDAGLGRRGSVTRRDLLLHVAELDRWTRSHTAAARSGSRRGRSGPGGPRSSAGAAGGGRSPRVPAPLPLNADAAPRREPRPGDADPGTPRWAVSQDRDRQAGVGGVGDATGAWAAGGVREAAARQSRAAAPVVPAELQPTQLALDLGDAPQLTVGVGLPEMSRAERVRAELEILGLDVSEHVLDPYSDLLDELGVVRSADLLSVRTRSEILVAGSKVATQTPPVRSGRRVVFLTLDDPTGPVDATFFEDAQGPYAATVFGSWMLLVRGVVRRTGPRGVSLRATGAWELGEVCSLWQTRGSAAVQALLAPPLEVTTPEAESGTPGTARGRRVLVHPSGYRQSPYADVRAAGENVRTGRKLWHASPGSSGR